MSFFNSRKATDMAHAIVVKRVDEEYAFLARQKCPGGHVGYKKSPDQIAISRIVGGGAFDVIDGVCTSCGHEREFWFDIGELPAHEPFAKWSDIARSLPRDVEGDVPCPACGKAVRYHWGNILKSQARCKHCRQVVRFDGMSLYQNLVRANERHEGPPRPHKRDVEITTESVATVQGSHYWPLVVTHSSLRFVIHIGDTLCRAVHLAFDDNRSKDVVKEQMVTALQQGLRNVLEQRSNVIAIPRNALLFPPDHVIDVIGQGICGIGAHELVGLDRRTNLYFVLVDRSPCISGFDEEGGQYYLNNVIFEELIPKAGEKIGRYFLAGTFASLLLVAAQVPRSTREVLTRRLDQLLSAAEHQELSKVLGDIVEG